MKLTRLLVAAALAACAFASVAPAFAQPAGAVQAVTPLTRDIGAILTLTAQVPATVNSADQSGYNVSRVVCVVRESANVGGTSAVFTLQNKDAASGQYYNLVSSVGIAVTGMTSPISAGVGITSVANVSSNTHPIARTWRVQAVLTGGTSWTGTVGCSVQ